MAAAKKLLQARIKICESNAKRSFDPWATFARASVALVRTSLSLTRWLPAHPPRHVRVLLLGALIDSVPRCIDCIALTGPARGHERDSVRSGGRGRGPARTGRAQGCSQGCVRGNLQQRVRACLPACTFLAFRSLTTPKSIPHVEKLVPGGDIDSVKIHVKLGVPAAHRPSPSPTLQECFPYGKLLPVEVVEGGLVASSGTVLAELGDASDQMIIVVAAVTVGY